MKLDRLRQRAKQKLQELEALGVFTHQINDNNAEALASARSQVEKAGSKRLAEPKDRVPLKLTVKSNDKSGVASTV